jgi:hypothetical protein
MRKTRDQKLREALARALMGLKLPKGTKVELTLPKGKRKPRGADERAIKARLLGHRPRVTDAMIAVGLSKLQEWLNTGHAHTGGASYETARKAVQGRFAETSL